MNSLSQLSGQESRTGPECTMRPSLMCEISHDQDEHFVEKYALSMEASPALAFPVTDSENRVILPLISGRSPSTALAEWSQATSCWKMLGDWQLGLLDEHPTQPQLSDNWPITGIAVDGLLYQLPTPTIEDRDFSYWPTVTTAEAGKISSPYGQLGLSNHPAIYGDRTDRPKRGKSRKGDNTKTKSDQPQRELLNARWIEALMGFPPGWGDVHNPLDPEDWEDWKNKMLDNPAEWWVNGAETATHPMERGLPRTIPSRSMPDRNKRIFCMGNALVPIQLKTFLDIVRE